MTRISLALVLALLTLPLTLIGCGQKAWPGPDSTQDAYQWAAVDFSRDKGCLFIDATLSGAAQNVVSVTVEIELMNDGCPGCPFNLDLGRQIFPGDPGFRQSGSHLQMYLCGLDPQEAYRFRLKGENAFTGLPTAVSDVYTAAP
ncbi:MAG: hypothetical protein AB7D07_06465 [Desulfovibrionaceae bacterium]